ncbi:hypothetical protein COO60DRAFT_1461348 [Scenedesmus sp. NREL 46B-D3]|nr:hypothetical protein COO60DRAFT_1461348 [Scenedesmus sp. NREL 46B-D3]
MGLRLLMALMLFLMLLCVSAGRELLQDTDATGGQDELARCAPLPLLQQVMINTATSPAEFYPGYEGKGIFHNYKLLCKLQICSPGWRSSCGSGKLGDCRKKACRVQIATEGAVCDISPCVQGNCYGGKCMGKGAATCPSAPDDCKKVIAASGPCGLTETTHVLNCVTAASGTQYRLLALTAVMVFADSDASAGAGPVTASCAWFMQMALLHNMPLFLAATTQNGNECDVTYRCSQRSGQCREICPKPNGSPCKNGTGSCESGVCIPTTPPCPEDPNKCQKYVYDPNSRQCNLEDTTCTQPPGVKYSCKTRSDCDFKTGLCVTTDRENTVKCPNGHCQNGECVPNKKCPDDTTCSAITQPFTITQPSTTCAAVSSSCCPAAPFTSAITITQPFTSAITITQPFTSAITITQPFTITQPTTLQKRFRLQELWMLLLWRVQAEDAVETMYVRQSLTLTITEAINQPFTISITQPFTISITVTQPFTNAITITQPFTITQPSTLQKRFRLQELWMLLLWRVQAEDAVETMYVRQTLTLTLTEAITQPFTISITVTQPFTISITVSQPFTNTQPSTLQKRFRLQELWMLLLWRVQAEDAVETMYVRQTLTLTLTEAITQPFTISITVTQPFTISITVSQPFTNTQPSTLQKRFRLQELWMLLLWRVQAEDAVETMYVRQTLTLTLTKAINQPFTISITVTQPFTNAITITQPFTNAITITQPFTITQPSTLQKRFRLQELWMLLLWRVQAEDAVETMYVRQTLTLTLTKAINQPFTISITVTQPFTNAITITQPFTNAITITQPFTITQPSTLQKRFRLQELWMLLLWRVQAEDAVETMYVRQTLTLTLTEAINQPFTISITVTQPFTNAITITQPFTNAITITQPFTITQPSTFKAAVNSRATTTRARNQTQAGFVTASNHVPPTIVTLLEETLARGTAQVVRLCVT